MLDRTHSAIGQLVENPENGEHFGFEKSWINQWHRRF